MLSEKPYLDCSMARRRYLTKSRFKVGHECPTRLYYLDRRDEYANLDSDDPFLEALAEGGFQVGARNSRRIRNVVANHVPNGNLRSTIHIDVLDDALVRFRDKGCQSLDVGTEVYVRRACSNKLLKYCTSTAHT